MRKGVFWRLFCANTLRICRNIYPDFRVSQNLNPPPPHQIRCCNLGYLDSQTSFLETNSWYRRWILAVRSVESVIFFCFIANEHQNTKRRKYTRTFNFSQFNFYQDKIERTHSLAIAGEWSDWSRKLFNENKIHHELPTVHLQTLFPSWCTIILEVMLAAMLSCITRDISHSKRIGISVLLTLLVIVFDQSSR